LKKGSSGSALPQAFERKDEYSYKINLENLNGDSLKQNFSK